MITPQIITKKHWLKLKRNRKLSVISLVLGLSVPVCMASDSFQSRIQLKPDSLEDAFITKAMSYVNIDSFQVATVCIESLITVDSDYWPAYVIKAGIIYVEMTDDERYDREKYFKALIDTSLAGLDEHLKHHPDDKWALFFKGTALGYQAIWEGQHGSWFKAIMKGLKAGKYFSRAVKKDTLFYEAYVGLGTLHYWRSAKLGILRKLPFIPDKRQQGIDELKKAMEKSRYSSTAAAIGLGWIYIDCKEYHKAVAVADQLIARGEDGRQTLWIRAVANFNRGNISGTIKDFNQIKEGLLKKGNQNYYNLVICGYCLGVAHYLKGDNETALGYFDEILNYDLSTEIEKMAAKKLKSAEKYKKKITRKEKSAEF